MTRANKPSSFYVCVRTNKYCKAKSLKKIQIFFHNFFFTCSSCLFQFVFLAFEYFSSFFLSCFIKLGSSSFYFFTCTRKFQVFRFQSFTLHSVNLSKYFSSFKLFTLNHIFSDTISYSLGFKMEQKNLEIEKFTTQFYRR